MDSPISKPPEIKPEVMRDDEKDKGGFLGSLLSRLGLGPAGAAGGAGGGGFGGALGGAGVGGGLLATKAGLVGLILVGSTVAGGIGLVGYKVFGPTASDRTDAGYSSLFQTRPKAAPGAEGEENKAEAPKDGSSASLQYLAQANSDLAGKEKKPDGSAAGQAPAPASASPASIGTARDNNAAPVAKAGAGLKSGMKIGGLTKVGGGGGGGGSSASSGGGAVPNNLPASAKTGNLSGFAAGSKGPGALKGVMGGKKGAIQSNTLGLVRMVRRDQNNPSSSNQAGTTYQNGGRGAAGIQGPASPGDGGLGVGGPGKGGAGPTLNPAGDPSRFGPPPTPENVANVTPWQHLIKFAQMLLAASILLIMMANKLAKSGTPPYVGPRILASIAALLALWVIAIGAKIGGGQWGQQAQGSMFCLAGGLIATSAVVLAYNPVAATGSGLSTYIFWISGALGVGAVIGGMLQKPKSFPPSNFDNGKPPDQKIIMHAPSDNVLFAFLPESGADKNA